MVQFTPVPGSASSHQRDFELPTTAKRLINEVRRCEAATGASDVVDLNDSSHNWSSLFIGQ
jgi:hypothetical protein